MNDISSDCTPQTSNSSVRSNYLVCMFGQIICLEIGMDEYTITRGPKLCVNILLIIAVSICLASLAIKRTEVPVPSVIGFRANTYFTSCSSSTFCCTNTQTKITLPHNTYLTASTLVASRARFSISFLHCRRGLVRMYSMHPKTCCCQ